MKLTSRKQQRLNDWLNGMSLPEKIAACERGFNVTCLCCGLTIFDKQMEEKWVKGQRRCPAHIFVKNGGYLILSREFSGISEVVWLGESESAEHVVLDYFQRRN